MPIEISIAGSTPGALATVDDDGNVVELAPPDNGFILGGIEGKPTWVAVEDAYFTWDSIKPGTVGSDWDPGRGEPADVGEALRRCAALLKTLNGGVGP